MKTYRMIALMLATLMFVCVAVPVTAVMPDNRDYGDGEAPPQSVAGEIPPNEAAAGGAEQEEQQSADKQRLQLPPEGPYAALIVSLREAMSRGHIAMPRTLEGWLVSRATLVSGGLEVAVPIFTEAKSGALTKYSGEEPSIYMQLVVGQLADQMMLIPMDADVGRIYIQDGAGPNETLVEALIQVGEDMERWIGVQLTQAKAYGALTRLLFDIGDMNKTHWRYVDFQTKDQAPVYGTRSARKLLKEGDAGPTVRALQEALQAQGYLVTDRTNGTFGQNMTEAVMRYQAMNGFPITGQLTPEEQYRIFGEIQPYSLPEELGKAWGREDDFAIWWPLFVSCLSSVSWSGSTVTVASKNFEPYEDYVFEFVMSVLLFDKKYGVD
ncbi:MAG: peptidoglycan-binding protein, partial [Clostridia bacterium]|nr:peptidoglycan-binding protein [Clostridia bacterium]